MLKCYLIKAVEKLKKYSFHLFFYHFLGKIFRHNGHAAEGIRFQLFGFVFIHKTPESFIKIYDYSCQTWVGVYRELLLMLCPMLGSPI